MLTSCDDNSPHLHLRMMGELMGSVDRFKVFWSFLPPVLFGRSKKFTIYECLLYPKDHHSCSLYPLLTFSTTFWGGYYSVVNGWENWLREVTWLVQDHSSRVQIQIPPSDLTDPLLPPSLPWCAGKEFLSLLYLPSPFFKVLSFHWLRQELITLPVCWVAVFPG